MASQESPSAVTSAVPSGSAAVEVVLRDGTQGYIWPLLLEDKEGLRVAYAALSREAKYSRFLSEVDTLSDSMLRLLVDSVDGVDHVALLLVVLPADGDEAFAGIGRIVRHPDQPDAADVAVTVSEGWRGHGVASALLAELVRRRPAGVVRLKTQVATDNAPSLAMLRRLGDLRLPGVDAGVYDVVVELPVESSRPTEVPAQAPRKAQLTSA